MRTKKTKLAIFDIDGTVFRSSLLVEGFNALVSSGIFPRSAETEIKKNYVAWLNRKGHYDDYLMQLVRVYYRNLKGKKQSKVEPVIDKVIAHQRDRVYRYTRDMLDTLRKENYFLLAISNSQDAMVIRYAKSFGFDGALGRPIEIVDGIYTGGCIVDGKSFPIDVKLDKPALLKSFLKEKALNANLADSYAFGDSEGDLEILSSVGHPVAFNPSYELAKIAEERDWQIVVERKDVMYRIHKADIMVSERPREKSKM